MNEWVRKVCGACGMDNEEEQEDLGGFEPTLPPPPPPPELNDKKISSPYIHISTCYTGGAPKSPPKRGETHQQQQQQQQQQQLELSNYEMGDDSVFESPPKVPSRPPKPAHLTNKIPSPPLMQNGGNYANAEDMQQVFHGMVSNPPPDNDDSNFGKPDVSRDLKPGRICSKANTVSGLAARRGQQVPPVAQPTGSPSSAPPVPRSLKPKNNAENEQQNRRYHGRRKRAGFLPGESKTLPRNYHSGFAGDDDIFALSPSSSSSTRSSHHHHHHHHHFSTLSPNSSDSRRYSWSEQEEEQIYFYLPSLESSGAVKPPMIPASNFEHPALHYIDIDLPASSISPASAQHQHHVRNKFDFGMTSPPTGSGPPPGSTAAQEASTAYKKIDFVKTEAFNRTRNKVLEKYNKEQELQKA